MPREYKKKRLAEFWSHDERPTKIKKQINSSERWRAKREIQKQLEEELENPELDLIDEMNREAMAYDEPIECLECTKDYIMLNRLARTCLKLGIIIPVWTYKTYNKSCTHSSDTATTLEY